MSCLALFCLAAAAATTTAADSAGLAAAVAAAKPSPHRAALARHEGFHRGLEPWPRSVPGTGSLFRPYTYIFGQSLDFYHYWKKTNASHYIKK